MLLGGGRDGRDWRGPRTADRAQYSYAIASSANGLDWVALPIGLGGVGLGGVCGNWDCGDGDACGGGGGGCPRSWESGLRRCLQFAQPDKPPFGASSSCRLAVA
jgi:hypothetical protein